MKHDSIPTRQTIAKARQRLGAAELSVEILQTFVSEAAPESLVAGTARAWLHERERSVYSRRLELDALLKARREADPRLHFIPR